MHYLTLITALLLVLTVGHMDRHISDSATKPAKVPKVSEQATYEFECDARLSLLCHS